MNFNQLIDAAKTAANIRTDNALGPHIGLTNSAANVWRRGKALPSEKAVFELCKLANEDPEKWILLLRMEMAAPEVKPVFKASLDRLNREKSAA